MFLLWLRSKAACWRSPQGGSAAVRQGLSFGSGGGEKTFPPPVRSFGGLFGPVFGGGRRTPRALASSRPRRRPLPARCARSASYRRLSAGAGACGWCFRSSVTSRPRLSLRPDEASQTRTQRKFWITKKEVKEDFIRLRRKKRGGKYGQRTSVNQFVSIMRSESTIAIRKPCELAKTYHRQIKSQGATSRSGEILFVSWYLFCDEIRRALGILTIFFILLKGFRRG